MIKWLKRRKKSTPREREQEAWRAMGCPTGPDAARFEWVLTEARR